MPLCPRSGDFVCLGRGHPRGCPLRHPCKPSLMPSLTPGWGRGGGGGILSCQRREGVTQGLSGPCLSLVEDSFRRRECHSSAGPEIPPGSLPVTPWQPAVLVVGAVLTEGSCPCSVMEWGAETGHKAQCELHPSFLRKMLKELRGRGGHVSWGIRGGLTEVAETILREKGAREDIPERENGGQLLT